MLYPSRRTVIGGSLVSLVAFPQGAQAQRFPVEAPRADRLQSGDFLWPKPRNGCVIYSPAKLGASSITRERAIRPAMDRLNWEQQRADFLSKPPSDAPAETIARVSDLSYEEFRKDYDGIEVPYGCDWTAGSYGVGHVAIVERTATDVMVVEAAPPSVVRLTYAEWATRHEGDLVFHGRLKGIDLTLGPKIAQEARKHVGVRYGFFNFNLLNDASFYCSKLAWAAVWRATGRAVDGNPDPKRWLWFSPKQMYYSSEIQHLNSDGLPGEYAPPRTLTVE